jgi:hypothetical protein
MAVDPHFLTVPPPPVPWPPDVIAAAYVITRAASIIRPVANLDCNGARTGVVGPAAIIGPRTVIRSVPGSRGIIVAASTDAKSGRN